MDTFNIYVTGDAQWFNYTLNAIAMIFNDGKLFWSVVLMAGIFAIITGAWHFIQKNLGSSLLRSHTWLEHSVVLVFLSALAIAPTRVVVQDIYGNENMTAIDNVPLILTLPASIFSSISYAVFNTLDTTLQGTGGSYMTVSQNGFATPLQLLFSMRGGLENTSTDLVASLRSYLVDCSLGSQINVRSYSTSNDLLENLLVNGRNNGITSSYINQSGTQALNTAQVVSCLEAKERIRNRFETATSDLATSDINRLINFNIRQTSEGQNSNNTFTIDDFNQAYQLLSSSGQSAQEFMRTALIRNIVADTYNCINSSYSKDAFVQCTRLQSDAMEQWKVDSTAAGSLFTKTMYPLMTLLQLMFFGFGVIIFFYALLRGAGALAALAKYALFGMWVFSWLPFVAVINAFIQWMVTHKISQLPKEGLTFESYHAYMYDVLSTNLATASDMLAATPLVTLGLLSGSAYAVAGLAQRMSARDYVDEGSVAPQTVTTEPVTRVTAQHQGNVSTGTYNEGYAGYEYNVKTDLSNEVASAHRESEAAKVAAVSSFGQMASSMRMEQSGTQVQHTDKYGNNVSFGDKVQDMESYVVDALKKEGYSDSEAAEHAKTLTGRIGAHADFGAGGQASPVSAGVGGSLDQATSRTTREATGSGLDESSSQGLKDAYSHAYEFVSKHSNDISDTYTTLGGVTGIDTAGAVSDFKSSVEKARGAEDTYQEVAARQETFSAGIRVGTAELGSMIQSDANSPDSILASYKINEVFDEAYRDNPHQMNALMNNAERVLTNNGRSQPAALEEQKMLFALRSAGGENEQAANKIIADLYGAGMPTANYASNAGIGAKAINAPEPGFNPNVYGSMTGGLDQAQGRRPNVGMDEGMANKSVNDTLEKIEQAKDKEFGQLFTYKDPETGETMNVARINPDHLSEGMTRQATTDILKRAGLDPDNLPSAGVLSSMFNDDSQALRRVYQGLGKDVPGWVDELDRLVPTGASQELNVPQASEYSSDPNRSVPQYVEGAIVTSDTANQAVPADSQPRAETPVAQVAAAPVATPVTRDDTLG